MHQTNDQKEEKGKKKRNLGELEVVGSKTSMHIVTAVRDTTITASSLLPSFFVSLSP